MILLYVPHDVRHTSDVAAYGRCVTVRSSLPVPLSRIHSFEHARGQSKHSACCTSGFGLYEYRPEPLSYVCHIYIEVLILKYRRFDGDKSPAGCSVDLPTTPIIFKVAS